MKYEKAKEWKIPCVNAQWLCDILLGNFEALRQIQHSRYSVYSQPEPLMPNPQLVQNLLGMSNQACRNKQSINKMRVMIIIIISPMMNILSRVYFFTSSSQSI